MSDSAETLNNQDSAVLKAAADLSARIDSRFEAINQKLDEHDIRFEAIRIGIAADSAAFDRLQAKIFNLSADVKELTEEVHQTRNAVMRETSVLEK